MKNSSRKKWIVTLCVLVVCIVGAVLWWVLQKGPTLAQVERRVRKELPLGRTQHEVEAWLKGNNITPGKFDQQYVVVEGPSQDQRGSDRVVDLASPTLDEREIGTTIRASVAPAFVDFVFEGEVTVYFFFDKRRILIGYAFDPWVHAL